METDSTAYILSDPFYLSFHCQFPILPSTISPNQTPFPLLFSFPQKLDAFLRFRPVRPPSAPPVSPPPPPPCPQAGAVLLLCILRPSHYRFFLSGHSAAALASPPLPYPAPRFIWKKTSFTAADSLNPYLWTKASTAPAFVVAWTNPCYSKRFFGGVSWSGLVFWCSRAGNCHAEVRQAAEMAASGEFKNKSELRVFESTDELATDLAEYISQLSENSVKESGCFTIALSGGSLISFMG